jgi:hypothetical protein
MSGQNKGMQTRSHLERTVQWRAVKTPKKPGERLFGFGARGVVCTFRSFTCTFL